jgi:hypothetical protein
MISARSCLAAGVAETFCSELSVGIGFSPDQTSMILQQRPRRHRERGLPREAMTTLLKVSSASIRHALN